MKFDFDDILIQPAEISDIKSRKNVQIKDDKGFLPLFAAPMDTVVDLTNYKKYLDNGIRVVLPRTIKESDLPYTENSEYLWFSYGLDDMTDLFLSDITGEKVNSRSYYIQNHLKNNKLHILIDIANGHQNNLHNLIKALKTKYPENLVMMVGNIANPKTYELLSELGVWGIRCTIGNGSGCWTKGTKIKTIGGDKFIEDVNTDDKVLTHTGEYKDVIMTQSLKYNDDLIEINNNVSTKDHKYYIIDIIDKDKITDNNIHEYAKWVEAEFLDEEKHLLIEMVNIGIQWKKHKK